MSTKGNQMILINSLIHRYRTLHVREIRKDIPGYTLVIEEWYNNDYCSNNTEAHITVNWLHSHDEVDDNGSVTKVPEISCVIDVPLPLTYDSYAVVMNFIITIGRKRIHTLQYKDICWNTKYYAVNINGKRIL